MEKELKKYFDNMASNMKYIKYPIAGREYILGHLWKVSYKFTIDNQHRFVPDKGTKLKTYLYTLLRSKFSSELQKIIKNKPYENEILKPYYREKRLDILLNR